MECCCRLLQCWLLHCCCFPLQLLLMMEKCPPLGAAAPAADLLLLLLLASSSSTTAVFLLMLLAQGRAAQEERNLQATTGKAPAHSSQLSQQLPRHTQACSTGACASNQACMQQANHGRAADMIRRWDSCCCRYYQQIKRVVKYPMVTEGPLKHCHICPSVLGPRASF